MTRPVWIYEIAEWIWKCTAVLSVLLLIAQPIFGGLLVLFLVVGIGGNLLSLLMWMIFDILEFKAFEREMAKKEKEWSDSNHRGRIFRILRKLEIV